MKIYKNRFEWHLDMNREINAAMSNIDPRDWSQEDFITRTILRRLRDAFPNTKLIHDKVMGGNVRVCWDIFKNTNKLNIEPTHGDIGLLIQMEFKNNTILEGVAFMEAKRLYPQSNRFESLDFDQLKRLVTNSAHHRTVFYDARPGFFNDAQAYGMPSQHVIAIDDDSSTELLPYSEYLSYILTNRYLQGYELDYSKDSISNLKNAATDTGGVKYLVVAQASAISDTQLSIDKVEFNRQVYTQLQD